MGLIFICMMLIGFATGGRISMDEDNNIQSTPFRANTPQRFSSTNIPLRPIGSLEPRRPEFRPVGEGIVTLIVTLDGAPALRRVRGVEFSQQVLNLHKQQDNLINILTAEPYNVTLIGRLTLSANALIITVDASWIESIEELEGVASVRMDRPMRLGE